MRRFLGEDGVGSIEAARGVVIPVPFDGTCSWIRGAARGPGAIIEASPALEMYDLETRTQPSDAGIATGDSVIGASVEEIEAGVRGATGRAWDAGKVPVLLGGEHSVSVGAIREAASRFDDLTVVQFDAHADTRERYEGSALSHACVMARAREVAPIVQVGIRSVDRSELARLDEARVLWAGEILADRDGVWLERLGAMLGDRVYVTVDVDGFDPGVVPCTGTPEPGGLGWSHFNAMLGVISSRSRIVGGDVVELCPPEGEMSVLGAGSAFTAAKCAYRIFAEAFRAGDS